MVKASRPWLVSSGPAYQQLIVHGLDSQIRYQSRETYYTNPTSKTLKKLQLIL